MQKKKCAELTLHFYFFKRSFQECFTQKPLESITSFLWSRKKLPTEKNAQTVPSPRRCFETADGATSCITAVRAARLSTGKMENTNSSACQRSRGRLSSWRQRLMALCCAPSASNRSRARRRFRADTRSTRVASRNCANSACPRRAPCAGPRCQLSTSSLQKF